MKGQALPRNASVDHDGETITVTVDEEHPLHRLVTTDEAASLCAVGINTILQWKSRGYMVAIIRGGKHERERRYLENAVDDTGRKIKDDHGRLVYRLVDVYRAEQATRKSIRRG